MSDPSIAAAVLLLLHTVRNSHWIGDFRSGDLSSAPSSRRGGCGGRRTLKDRSKQHTSLKKKAKGLPADAPETIASSAAPLSLLLLCCCRTITAKRSWCKCAVLQCWVLAPNTAGKIKRVGSIRFWKKSWKALLIRDTGWRLIRSLVPGRALPSCLDFILSRAV